MGNIIDSEDWPALATDAQNGDKKAYALLLKSIVPYIKNNLTKSVSSHDAIEDIIQEVLISVHKSLNTYSPERPFKPWLYSIINFRKTDYMRKYYSSRDDKRAPLENLDFENVNVTNQGYEGELRDVEVALSKFPKQQQLIFKRIKIEGYTAKEVANELGMKESAVKVSAHRTLEKLKGKLQ